MTDIQSAAAEIGRGNKKEEERRRTNHCMKIYMVSLLHRATIKKSPSWHHPTTLSGYIFATKACIDNRTKNFLSSNISCTCFHNMVNFGPLAAEIISLVWGTPANFNWFCVLAALLLGTLVVGVSQTLRH